ncbi:MAG: Zn-dependent hydrolase [Mesorhizobium sp. SCN 65-12]|nr:MAG: Zn-dependent hydrolase [Mesorhizobium sp. SCN 65-12]
MSRPGQRPNLPVSAARIAADIDKLAAITEPGRPWTRRAFSPLHREGRAWLADRFQAAGLETRIDASGNLIGRRAGRLPGSGTLMLGSHSDTVPDGGRFDGIAGVIAALEVARSLADAGIQLDHDLEIVDFLAEEVSIFGVSCIGSRGMAGVRPPEWLERQAEGMTLAQGLVAAGGREAPDPARQDIKAFLELHIEQGPVLETEKRDIGIVSAIAGIARIEIVLEGRADHAGTTPMGARRDALVAASKLVLGIEHLATDLSRQPRHFAATVGEFAMLPNAANVVPSNVRMLVDVRSEQRDDLDNFAAALNDLCISVAEKDHVDVSPRRISDAPAVRMDDGIGGMLANATESLGGSHRQLASGAGHDAAFMARISRAAMIFIPCLGGRSHAPEEFAENDDIAFGAAVLLETVRALDRQISE